MLLSQPLLRYCLLLSTSSHPRQWSLRVVAVTPRHALGAVRNFPRSVPGSRSSTRILLQDSEYVAMAAPSASMVQWVTSTSNIDVDEESNEVADGAPTTEGPPSGFWRHRLAAVQNFSFPGGSIRLLQDLRGNLSSLRKQIHQKFSMGLGLPLQARHTHLLIACILFPLLACGVLALVCCRHTADMHRSHRALQGSVGSRSGRLKQPPPSMGMPVTGLCTLLVPTLEISEDSPNGIISISDVNNYAVFLISYSIMPNPQKATYDVQEDGKRLVLRSALDNVALASCRDAEPDPAGGPPGLTILSQADEICGTLQPSGPGSRSSYVLALWSGQKVLIRKDVRGRCTYATDEDGWMLAYFKEETPKAKQMLKISPQADAGLITLAILGTELMEIGIVVPHA